MTRKLYDDRPYDTTFTATVVSISLNVDHTLDLVLDGTLFFPEEGGQTPDRGVIYISEKKYDVIDVQIQSGVIHHILTNSAANSSEITDEVFHPDSLIGFEVSGQIDWAHRFSNMQNHSGEHIFSGLVHAKFGYNNVGFHLSDSEVTMDYDGVLTDADVEALEDEANAIIYQNLAIDCRYPSPAELATLDYRSKLDLKEDVRIVTIPGVDVCACCAPHVRTTAEIGLLKVLSAVSYKGGTRLSILCGGRAIRDYQKKHQELRAISQSLKVPILETAAGVDKLLAERAQLQESIHHLNEEKLMKIVQAVPADQKHVFLLADACDVNLLRRTVNELTSKHSGFSGIFWKEDDGDIYRYILGASHVVGSDATNANVPNQILKEKFSARGGGKAEMVQGSVATTWENIKEALASLT